MAYSVFSQANFTKGELSPFMYARGDNDTYYKGLKVAQNVLIYPTGAAGKRFGTLYQATLTNINTGLDFFFQTFQYLNQCIYQLVFTAGTTYIYLEGIQVSSFSNPYDATTVANLSTTVLTNSSGAVFRVCAPNFQPYDLTRSHVDGTISSISSNRFVITGLTLTVGEVLPIQFTTTGTLPSTTPQIIAGKTYFCYQNTTSASSIYLTPQDAKFQTNAITLTNTGSGTNKILYYNAWTFSPTTWKNLPFYDFTGGYDNITFTPTGATTGIITLVASSAIFTSAHVGGAFFGNGGTARIIAFTDSTHVTIAVQNPFISTMAIQGSLCLLAEPAWSATRGYPQICSSYQNRAIFANTPLLNNGFWTSVINDYTDFGDLTTDDDDAIAFYPNFNNINVINFVVPFRSITVHTNSGVYSNPLSEIYAITPNTFTLQLQDTTPAQVLEPQSIDNQILIVSGNDLHTMIWDGINNAYTSNIVSVANEQTIRNPVDQISYANLTRSGSRYCFIVNANGSMAVYQTLQSENVQGITPQILEQTFGDASFVQAASSLDGRAWFVCQRQSAFPASGISISGFTTNSLQATASNFSTTTPTPITFTTSGSLPTGSISLATNTFYWAVGIDANDFYVYANQSDAIAQNTNYVTFSNAGTSSEVVPWPGSPVYTLEELTEDVKIDCAVYVNNGGSPSATATVPSFMNAQSLVAIGDDYGFSGNVENSVFTFNVHGSDVNVTEAYIGYAINLVIEPMPLSFPPGPQTTLMKPTHLRSIRWWFNNTIGGTINGSPIAISSFANVGIGEPPVPRNGIFEMSVMTGWDDINFPSFTIEHSEPFDIQLLGISYSIDV